MPRRELGVEVALEAIHDGMHVAHRAIPQKRHRAVRHPSMGFYFGPPHAAMSDADSIDIERLGDDDVIDARRREPTALRQVMHSPISARFFVGGARYLQRSGQPCVAVDQGFDGDDGRREPALHVACAPAVDLAVDDRGAEGVLRPPAAALYDIDMAVEMHARSGCRALATRNHVDARITLGVAGRALRT